MKTKLINMRFMRVAQLSADWVSSSTIRDCFSVGQDNYRKQTITLSVRPTDREVDPKPGQVFEGCW
jgi:hypothetical protein